ncbi:MAG: right-handed parallel beta-helix repeat-containing protein [Phycisphaerales bacterium]|nr:MAG: right-handed parallel beta-helix repeat-containing protein [Phycisphaerales bacterium]
MSVTMFRLSAVGLVCLCTPLALAEVRFVNIALTSGTDTGASWANAYRGTGALNRALADANPGDEIWVAAGTYRGEEDATFSPAAYTLRTDISLYGGFAGTETARNQRDPAAHLCTLSADANADDNATLNLADNYAHVLEATGVVSGVIVDGFTITAGNAVGVGSNLDRGGGVLLVDGASATFANCTFTNNRCTFGGGAGYINTAVASFTRCTFADNVGGSYGGAFDTNNGFTTFVACRFIRNSAGRAGGLEVYGSNGISTIRNCSFIANRSTGAGGNSGGGALWIGQGAQATIAHCTITANQAIQTSAGGIRLSGASAVAIRGSILWANTGTGTNQSTWQIGGGVPTVRFSCIQAWASGGEGIITADPLLLPTGALRWGSPCIDAGDGTALNASDTLDLDARRRDRNDPAKPDTGLATSSGKVPDIGALEFQGSSCIADLFGGGDANTPGEPDGGVTIDDLLAYLEVFASGQDLADVSGGEAEGAPDQGVTIDDLLYYLERFAAGC